MKKYLILTAICALPLLTQCTQQLSRPSNVSITADKHRTLVREWIENMDKQSRLMEDIKCTSEANDVAAEIRELGRTIKLQQETIEAPLTKRVYEQTMNLPEFRERINAAQWRNLNAKKSLKSKDYFDSTALRFAM